MSSLIFRTATRVITPVMLLLSVIVLLRGHNEPGGGFVGGLLAASGLALHALAFRSASARRLLRANPVTLVGIGLVLATVSGLPSLLAGDPYLRGRWASIDLVGFPDPIKIGTPVLFDIGVYLLVLGGTLLMVLSLEEVPYRRDDARRGADQGGEA